MTSSSSVNADEIAHFSRLSSQWWDEHGEFGLLHKMNPVRLQFIRNKLLEVTLDNSTEDAEFAALQSNSPAKILRGKDVLDVGCGGGLLSESLARLGGTTLGIDASASNIAIASLHATSDPCLTPKDSSSQHPLQYRHCTAEDLVAEQRQFDVVCSLEVVEHVDNPAGFLTSCAQLVKPGGHLFLSTVARTPLSYALTILAAEHILGLVTPGTHTHSKFINPSELTKFFVDLGWISRTYANGHPTRAEGEVRGIAYIPWRGQWILAPRDSWGSTDCNYLFWVRKPSDLAP